MTIEQPIPGYDDLSEPDVQALLRSMPLRQVQRILAYEPGHADRTAVLLAAEYRLAELKSATGKRAR